MTVAKWAHLRAAPFSEITDLLEQQDQALARSGDQLKKGTAQVAVVTELIRAADRAIEKLLGEKRSLLGNLEDQTNATAAQKRRADEAIELLKELWRLCCASRGDTPAHRDIEEMNAAWDRVRDFLGRPQ